MTDLQHTASGRASRPRRGGRRAVIVLLLVTGAFSSSSMLPGLGGHDMAAGSDREMSTEATISRDGVAVDFEMREPGDVDESAPKLSFCEYNWNERPGYADYTAINRYERSGGVKAIRNFPALDRLERHTLQGGTALTGGMCQNARLLKRCFDRVLNDHSVRGLSTYLEWAEVKQRLDPLRVHMAFAMQETILGLLPDKCFSGGICHGIGMMQILTAIDNDGKVLKPRHSDWHGINHNLLTNLEYSVRLLAVKIDELGGNPDFDALAVYYNGSRRKKAYAKSVLAHYSQLRRCGLDEVQGEPYAAHPPTSSRIIQ